MRTVNSFIGSPVERLEDLRFLRGRGQFVDDVPRPDALHAVILRSSVAHGRVRNIDASAALKRPGVRAVITAADILSQGLSDVPVITMRQELLPEFKSFQQPVIAYDKVRYVGEPLAVVVADTQALAEDALEHVAVDIAPLPPVADRAAARADMSPMFEGRSNQVITLTARRGDAETAFRDAPYTRRERFQVQRFTAMTMETRGLLAEWDAANGHLTVSGLTKVVFHNRRILAKQMGLAEDAITMIEADVGGGFGVRGEFYPEDFLIPFAAKTLNRAVKWIEDRREHLIASNHARDAECELEIACERDGTIRGLRGRGAVDLGAYIRTNGVTAARNTAQVLSGPYRVPNIDFENTLLLTNKTPSGTYRGPGRFEADFFRERLFDMAANDLGIDRVEFRRRNLIAEHEMPWELPNVQPLDQGSATDTGDYRMTLDRCLHDFGWAEKAKLQGALIDGRYHGIAVGCYLEGGGSGPRENVRMALEDDGSVSLYVGSSSVGQGVETVFAQIAADALEMPMERINRVQHGSTDLCEAGLRLLFVALDRDGRLGHRAGRRQPEGCDPRRRGQAPAMRRRARLRSTATSRRAEPRQHCAHRARRRRYWLGRHLFEQQAHLFLRCACRPRGGRSEHRPCRADRLRGDRGRRPDHQSADAAWPDRGRHRAGPRRRVAGKPRL